MWIEGERIWVLGDWAPLPSRTSSASMTWFRFMYPQPRISRSTPARRPTDTQSSTPLQARSPKPGVVAFEQLLVIVGGGNVDAELLRELYASGGHLVGADGVLTRLWRPAEARADRGRFRSAEGTARLAGQDPADADRRAGNHRDFEKALYSTKAPVTIAVGMTGRRFDHTLAALDAVDALCTTAQDRAGRRGGRRWRSPRRSAEVAAGERVSIHPLAPVTFWRSDGLKYPLDAVKLAPGADGHLQRGADRTVPNRTRGGDPRPYPDPQARAPDGTDRRARRAGLSRTVRPRPRGIWRSPPSARPPAPSRRPAPRSGECARG